MSAERAAFMSMGDSSDFLPKKADKNAGGGGAKRKTTRLALDLFEPDENSFPEFNYAKLVQIEKVKFFFLMDFFSSPLSFSPRAAALLVVVTLSHLCERGEEEESKMKRRIHFFHRSYDVAAVLHVSCCCDSSNCYNQRLPRASSWLHGKKLQ